MIKIVDFLARPAHAAIGPEDWQQLKPNRCVRTFDFFTGEKGVQIPTLQGFECIFINLTRVLVPLMGIIFFIMLLVGSFQLITAGGEAKQIQKARKTFTFAIFGFVLFFGIWFILRLIQAITGVDVTKFEIPG